MAEVLGIVSGTLGLLPVVVEVIRGFQAVRKGLSVAIKSTKELQSIRDALRIQETRFLNECELLLRLVVTCEEAHEIMKDTDHHKWAEEAFNVMLEESLDRSYSACSTVVTMMQEAQQEISTELRAFDMIHTERRENESLRATFRRLRKSLKIAFEKSKYEQIVDRLRKGNEDLESLKQQIYEFRRGSDRGPISVSSSRVLPDSIKEVREISKEVYGALVGSFSCKETAHVEHSAALSIETEVGSNNTLDMVLSYLATNESLGQETTLRLCLRSHKNPYHDKGKRMASSEDVTKQRKKIRSLMPDDNVDDCTSSAEHQNHFASDPINISSIENACVYLEKAYRGYSCQAGLQQYLGYLRTSQSCRHIFYISPSTDSAQETLHPFSEYRAITLRDLLMATKPEGFTRSYQMRFALKAVMAVLKFHSTPWLSDSWKTSDLLLSEPSLLVPRHSSFLLRSHLPVHAPINDNNTTAKSVTATQEKEDTLMVAGVAEYMTPEDRYGVYNKVLWSLGAALLEIGHWETLDRLRSSSAGGVGCDNDDFNDILAARQLSKRKTMLGGKYDEMVRKCLRCDFGQGENLGTRELEEAVYGNIVCPLQDSIEKMEQLCI
ncbi:hypothetical protein F5X99DRAFT_409534 [Biscogniauxia marginata]|nr:hypothetical protein F5X99DRAFT_409534 [Biscogniauxia marginata]